MNNDEIIEKVKQIQKCNKMAIEFHDRVALDYIEEIVSDLLDALEDRSDEYEWDNPIK